MRIQICKLHTKPYKRGQFIFTWHRQFASNVRCLIKTKHLNYNISTKPKEKNKQTNIFHHLQMSAIIYDRNILNIIYCCLMIVDSWSSIKTYKQNKLVKKKEICIKNIKMKGKRGFNKSILFGFQKILLLWCSATKTRNLKKHYSNNHQLNNFTIIVYCAFVHFLNKQTEKIEQIN